VEELLQRQLTITFGQESLEFAVQSVETAIGDSFSALPFAFSIKILGGDLQRNGITRNQQIRDFDARNRTIAEILTAMVMQANPIKTVQSPDEEDQQLVWVIGPDPADPAQTSILLTTRAAAREKNYTLPLIFREKR
jgi:hypothetical protein